MILIYPHWQSNWAWSAGSLPFPGPAGRCHSPGFPGKAVGSASGWHPGTSWGHCGQSCWSTACQGPLAREIMAVSCPSEEVAEQMQEWFPCTHGCDKDLSWMLHPPVGPEQTTGQRWGQVPHLSVKSVPWNSCDQFKSYLDSLDTRPDRQESSRWQIREIICHQKHWSCTYKWVGWQRGEEGVWGGRGRRRFEQKTSYIILREDLFCHGLGCLNIWPKHLYVNQKHGKNKQEKATTNPSSGNHQNNQQSPPWGVILLWYHLYSKRDVKKK